MTESEAREDENKPGGESGGNGGAVAGGASAGGAGASAVAGGAGESAVPEAAAPSARIESAMAGRDGVGARVSCGQTVLVCVPAAWPGLAGALRDAGFELLADYCGADYCGYAAGAADPGCRFEVVANLLSVSHNERVRVRIPLDSADPRCASVCHVWPGAELFEREAYDMFGIVFEGHPDLSRILLPDEWEGFPLRKDYPTGRIPVQFSASPKPQ